MRFFCAVLGCALLGGCSQEQAVEVEVEVSSKASPQTPGPEAGASEDAQAPIDLDEARLAILRAADLHDGAEDGVVHECGRCALAMEGDAAHAVHLGDYELHFCSDPCKVAFEDDLPKGLTELEEFLAETQ